MDERNFEELLLDLFEEGEREGVFGQERVEVRGTFRELGLMTDNSGVVVRVGGVEFQLTVVRSR